MGRFTDRGIEGEVDDQQRPANEGALPMGPRAHSFHLRIWPQLDAGSKGSVWRGFVADLNGSNTRYFDSGDRLARILDESAGARFPGLGWIPGERE